MRCAEKVAAAYAMGQRDERERITSIDLIAWLHKRFEFEWDQCDHGVYVSSAPHNGQPYAMCERIGTALLAVIDAGKEAT